jgi:hypothetical protein
MAKREVVNGVNDVSIEFMDNGYVVRYSGYDTEGDWNEVRSVYTKLDDVITQIQHVDKVLKR